MLRKCGNCAQENVNYVYKSVLCTLCSAQIDDTGQVKGKNYTVQLKCIACLFYRILLASEMWIYHSHLEYEHSYH